MIQGIQDEYNRQRSTHQDNYPGQLSQTNPFVSVTPEADTAFKPSAPEQDLLSSTLTTHLGNQGDESDSDAKSDEPSLGNVFQTEYGWPNPIGLAMHYKAMYKGVKTGISLSQSKSTHKINYGCVQPPILHLDTELCSYIYELWKIQ